MFDLIELRELAADVRIYIDAAEDKASALRDVVEAYDVVFGIYPSGDEIGLHVVKGANILEMIAKTKSASHYSHTAIAVPDLSHAKALQELTAPLPLAA